MFLPLSGVAAMVLSAVAKPFMGPGNLMGPSHAAAMMPKYMVPWSIKRMARAELLCT